MKRVFSPPLVPFFSRGDLHGTAKRKLDELWMKGGLITTPYIIGRIGLSLHL